MVIGPPISRESNLSFAPLVGISNCHQCVFLIVVNRLTQIDGGLTMDGLRMTLKQYADSWLENKSLSLRPNTIILYRKTLEQHILPVLGKLILRDIQPTHIKRLYAIKKQEDRGARTIQLIHAVLHCLMKHAVRECILGKNPLDVIERPRTEQAEFQILNEEQCHQFLIAAADCH
jgi:site-specific recombinase XerD